MQTVAPNNVAKPFINGKPVASHKFDWLIVGLSVWMISGIQLDAWAHHQLSIETFFTPWHGVLHSGFLALALVLIGTFVRHVMRGHAWQQAMPAGYNLSLVGVAVFLVGGVGDMVWHMLFGIEVNIEVLLSPSHLLLALGGALLVTGPLRAAWVCTTNDSHWAALLPALLSLTLLLALLSFFTAYANPFTELLAAQAARPLDRQEIMANQALGITGILLQTGLMMGLLLLAVHRWSLKFGSLTLVLIISTALTVSTHTDFQLLPFVLGAGLIADTLEFIPICFVHL